jgi:anthranilate synthase component 2
MEIALIDNYDSFTYNLVQCIEEQSDAKICLFKNDDVRLLDLKGFDKIFISPGPGVPAESGLIMKVIKSYSGIIPIMGVCLGLQAIYEAFGGRLMNLQRVFHGVSSEVRIVDPYDPVLQNLSNPFRAGRYHSWVCDPDFLPDDLCITAWDEDEEIMACRHLSHPTYGVQFHPESFLTPEGNTLVGNFLQL